MKGLAATPDRQLEPVTVLEFLDRHYGVGGELRPLSGENHNFLIDTGSERLVLKIAAHGQTPAEYHLEHSLVEHLASHDISLSLPRSVQGRSGAPLELFAAGQPARLMRALDGQRWCDIEEPASAMLTALGAIVADVTRALESFDHPARGRSHVWNLETVAEYQSEIAGIEDPIHRRSMEDAFGLYLAGAVPLLRTLPRSWIHGDINDENLLVEAGEITGLIDFGDAVVGPTVGELAIALAYAMQRRDDPLAAGQRVVAAYLEHRTLIEDERSALVPLVHGRLVASVAMAARRRRLDHARPSYFTSETASWELLTRLGEISPGEIRRALLAEKPSPHLPADSLIAARRQRIGPSLSVAYERPLHIVRGAGQYLWNDEGRPYLDLVNNVCHVGHCHPQVVAAGQRQMAVLNTNTRYLYAGLTEYAERLAATLPAPLEVCFFVTSGSEANELALRMARTHTGRRDLLVVEGAYHGHTSTLIDISPYKFLGRGGSGRPEPWVHVVPMPDGYRGMHRGDGEETGIAYGDEVGRVAAAVGRPIAGLILESLLGCGGQIIPPPGYLATAYRHVRAAGGLCIADEVQVGFGRAGRAFWAFETQGVVPDIVVMGKPIGNGHPMAAVLTTREIADSFANGMEFFSTFGGNPVSCAIGLAVLDVIETEGLQEQARVLGSHFLAGLARLEEKHAIIGAVRGLGLFLGIELVHDRSTLEPAADLAARVVDRMKRRGVLLSTDGPLHNVLKIKPPMVLTRDDIDRTLRLLDEELAEVGG